MFQSHINVVLSLSRVSGIKSLCEYVYIEIDRDTVQTVRDREEKD